jgi:spoIIIJ-associated protein
MEEIEKSAASVEEAIEEALAELGLSEQEARIEILQEPKSGFLGRNAQAAVVRVRPAAPAAQVEGEIRDKQGDLAADVCNGYPSRGGAE